MLEVTILSVLQGISEFLPISSSGHLVIGKELLGLGEVGIRLDVFLHAGTLLAVIAFYFSTLRSLFLNMVSKGADRKEAPAPPDRWPWRKQRRLRQQRRC